MSRKYKVLLSTTFFILLGCPFMLNGYMIYILNMMGISIIIATGLNLVMGFTGQISLGHAGFVAIGAYTTGLLKVKLGIPFLLGWPIGGLLSGLIGFALGLPALRLRGHYLALATLGFGMSVQLIIFRWQSLTNGPRGFDMDPVSLHWFVLDTGEKIYYLILISVFLLVILARNIINSKTGRAFLAIRDHEIASQSMGIDLAKYKTLAFSLSAFYGGIAGGLYAALMMYISADNFGFFDSVSYVIMIVIGGMGSIPGSIIGVILVYLTQELLRGFQEYQGMIYGVAVIVFIVFMPSGVYSVMLEFKKK